MTTPPKPLTEKELEEMEGSLATALYERKNKLSLSWQQEGELVLYLDRAIQELKRLRAGPTREKILRDGIKKAMYHVKLMRARDHKAQFIEELLLDYVAEADAVKEPNHGG